MRTIIQRVTAASVTVEGKVVGAIEHGLMCLIGISANDKPEDIDYLYVMAHHHFFAAVLCVSHGCVCMHDV